MKRKILVTLLAFCLIASLCVVGAAASGTETGGGNIASITSGGTTNSYTTAKALREAINGATAGSVVEILDDFEIDITVQSDPTQGYFNISNSITINGNGHKITVATTGTSGKLNGSAWSNAHVFSFTGGTSRINGLTIEGSGVAHHGIHAYSSSADNQTSLTLNNVAINHCTTGVTVNGSVVIADNLKTSGSIWGGVNVDPKGKSASFTMNSGDLSAETTSVYINNDSANGTAAIDLNGGEYAAVGVATSDDNVKNVISIDGCKVDTVSVADADGDSSIVVSNSTVTTSVDNSAVVINSTVGNEYIESTAPDGVVAVIGTKQYKDLEDALEDAGTELVTIELVANADMDVTDSEYITVTRNTVINGNGHIINITVADGSTLDTRDKMFMLNGAHLTLNNATLNITGQNDGDGTYSGDAIDLIGGAHLYANDSFINIQNVGAGFVIETDGEDIVLNNTDVTVKNVNGNGSQGGNWVVNGSNISFTNCGDHGLSVETIKATNSVIDVDDADKLALFGSVIDLNSTAVNVTNSGSDLPVTEGYAETLGGYHSPVQVKGMATEPYLNIDAGSSITVTNSHNGNNTVYLPDGAELINNGTINATVTVPEDSDMCVVVFMADGAQYDVQVVDSGDSVRVPELDKNGYTFVGWRVNNSNTIVKGGESYPITANTTFTAVWNMINIPDTYEISVISSDGGTVEASLSNASAGSVITLTVTPDEGYELAYITVDGERISGTSFVMPDHSVEVRAVFTEIGAEMNFVDVNTGDWFYDAVEYVYTNGLMEGTSTRTFEPNATMTRAMFWTVLARIDGETITGDNWKTLAQNWAVSSGISDGTNADALITREQMVTMLYRYAGSPVTGGMAISEFTDGASVSDYATDAVAWALSEGILTGMGDGILAPQGTATRAQAAAMLMRFVEA